ncbi:SnoaL-like polyketide cyclase [Salinihabitans flavidus]|uniref:SnoaL-like polyketide cyclase n=1 Tax=Salinihabitans flavidus TaxID=569882 RepID=A0A1H8NL95_9RHOB|nr:nuclear transport factor 2 family protein [Salinihabitans flavidus]SEO30346.1 SnoaL-like polyketide cyclase [Salinihabitans flavidus]
MTLPFMGRGPAWEQALGVLQDKVETILKSFWCDGDTTSVERNYHPDAFVAGLEAEAFASLEDLIAFQRMLVAQLGERSLTIWQSVEDGHTIALQGEFTAVERRTGRPVRVAFQLMARIEEGLIVESHSLVDFLAAFEQLGRLPPRTLDLCLTDNAFAPVLKLA